ncbi:MAG: TIGR03905 family TSCPD domain-containing protein [Bacillota bacterium]|nr:TIGR03905 family TSCPD domain-containing protein [Bacillota bacterium]
MKYEFSPRGVCSTALEFELDGNTVKNVSFRGGCNGNLQAVSRLVEGLTVEEVQEKLAGIHCGMKSTSCADQLAHAIKEAAESAK